MATLLEVPKGMSAGPCLYGCGDETSAFSFHCSLPLLLLRGLVYLILQEHVRAEAHEQHKQSLQCLLGEPSEDASCHQTTK